LGDRGTDEAGRDGRGPSTVQPLAHWTFQDFRRTASSNLARLGVPLHVTEKLLNHQPQAIRVIRRARPDYFIRQGSEPTCSSNAFA